MAQRLRDTEAEGQWGTEAEGQKCQAGQKLREREAEAVGQRGQGTDRMRNREAE